MAAYAARIRVGRFGTCSGVHATRFTGSYARSSFSSPLERASLESSSTCLLTSPRCIQFDGRFMSQLVKSNGKRLFLVNTLAVVRKLEEEGVPSKHAEAITASVTSVLNDILENVTQSVVSEGEMQKVEITQESNVSKFKSEIHSSQEYHFSLLQHENEKLRHDIEKMQSDLRHEIDKITAAQRLDLNLEKGRIRDELTNRNTETSGLTNKLDREIHSLRAQLEAAKYDVIKHCIGTVVSISAVGLAVLRILL